MEQLEFFHCGWERKTVQPLWKTIWRFLKMLHIPFDPAILPLGIYPGELETFRQKLPRQKLYTNVLISTIHNSQIGNNPNVHQQMDG